MRAPKLLIWVLAILLTSCTGSTNTTTKNQGSLVFVVQPTDTTPAGTTSSAISPSIQVEVLNQYGQLIPNASNEITIAIANNPGSNLLLESVTTLSGPAITGEGMFAGLLAGVTSVNAVHGVATFSELAISQPGNGYTLVASAPGFESAISTAFNVVKSTAGYNKTANSGGAEIANLNNIGESFQGYTFVYVEQEPNPITESAFATWSQSGWITNTPRYPVFEYANTLGSPSAPVGPLTEYIDTYGYTWGYIAQIQSFDWPFDPSNYPSPEPTSGWQAGQTEATVPSGVIKYSSINKNQLYIFTAVNEVTGAPILRYFIRDQWGNVYTMKSSNRDNTTESEITAAFESAVLPDGWGKSMGYLPQDLYGYPVYSESYSMFNDLRDSADNAYTEIIWGNDGNSIAQQIGYPMPIYGGPSGTRINGNINGSSLMYGGNGDDQFYPESGGNIINGGAGYNGVFYLGDSVHYTISQLESATLVVGPNGTNDILTNIQYLHFNDKTINLGD